MDLARPNEQWLRPSAIEGFIQLRRLLSEAEDECVDRAITRLSFTYATAGFDFSTGARILSALPAAAEERDEQFRQVIGLVARELSPSWLQALPLGRTALRGALDLDAAECFVRAGAFDTPPSDHVIRWLDGLASLARADRDAERSEIGREGERRSFELERSRLASYPHAPPVEWIALDDNTAGFDIRSYHVDQGKFSPKLIEVKTCSSRYLEVWLSRNEWEVARRATHAYWLHIWYLAAMELTEISFQELSEHIPSDSGRGRWMTVRVAFSECF